MSTPDAPNSSDRSVKTLAIRLEPDLHAQLSLIAQLRSSTITDEIRLALAAHVASIKSQPDFVARADDVLDAIDREALARRQAIASLFGGPSPVAQPETTSESTEPNGTANRARKGRGTDSAS